MSALSAAQNRTFPRQFRLSADALEEKSDLQVFWILRLPGPKLDLEEKKSATMGSKFRGHFFDWGRLVSCSAASAGPEKWSGISQNSKIEWESGLFGCVLQLLDQRPAADMLRILNRFGAAGCIPNSNSRSRRNSMI